MADEPRRLDAELLAAYVDGRLPPDERTRVEAAIAENPEEYEWLVNAMRVSASLEAAEAAGKPAGAPGKPAAAAGVGEPAGVLPFYRRPRVQAAVGSALAAAALVLLALRIIGPESSGNPRVAGLVAAVGEERYIEGRLTGGFHYGPLRPVTRGPGDLSNRNLALLAAAGELQKAAEAEPTAENLHAWGVAQVLLGDAEGAAADLERAVREAPGSALYLVDLSAAHLAASAAGRLDQLPMALEAAERALTLDADLLEARFNRALALQRLGLVDAAIQAWEEYLRADAGSPWRAEAERQLAETRRLPSTGLWKELDGWLASGDVREVPAHFVPALSGIRTYLEQSVFDEWRQGRPLDRGIEVASALERATGDRFFTDVLEGLQQASGRAALRDGVGEYLAARTLFETNRFAAASGPLASVVRRLESVGSPLALWAEVQLAACEYYAAQYAAADARLVRLHTAAVARGYRNLEARATWVRALVAFSEGRLSDTERLYESTLETFERMNDPEQVGRAHSLLGSFRQYVGDGRRALVHRVLALRNPQQTLRDRYITVGAAASGLANLGLPAAGLSLQRQVVGIADAIGDEALRAEAYARLARMAAALGATVEARAEAARAEEALGRVADPIARDRMRVRVLAARADAIVRDDPRLAAETARQAIEIASGRRDTLIVAQLAAQAARGYLAAGDPAAADQAVQAGLTAFDAERSSLERTGRLSYSDEAWTLFDRAVEVAIARGDPSAAFDAAERGRARGLLEDRAIAPAPVPLAEVREAMADGQAVLLLHQLDDRLWLQLVRRRVSRLQPVELARIDAEHLVARFDSDVAAGAESSAAGASLFASLLAPIWSDLEGVSTLMIVPDAPYFGVPFAALERARGTVVADALAVSLLPSVSFWMKAARTAGRGRDSVLAVGPPAAMPGGLPSLPHARREAEAVAGAYTRRLVLSPADARGFAAQASSFATIHVATHAISNADAPALAYLAMDEPVYARDVERLDLGHGPLVVLAACQSLGVVAYRGEGPMGLARSFLAAGASAVVATLRDVDDETAMSLFERFHHQYQRGATPAVALRAAMLETRARYPALAAWSAVTVVGGEE